VRPALRCGAAPPSELGAPNNAPRQIVAATAAGARVDPARCRGAASGSPGRIGGPERRASGRALSRARPAVAPAHLHGKRTSHRCMHDRSKKRWAPGRYARFGRSAHTGRPADRRRPFRTLESPTRGTQRDAADSVSDRVVGRVRPREDPDGFVDRVQYRSSTVAGLDSSPKLDGQKRRAVRR